MTSNTVESGAFLRLNPTDTVPQLGLIVAPALKNQPQRLIPVGHGISLHVAVMHPKSRGQVRLRSADQRTNRKWTATSSAIRTICTPW